MPFQGVDFWGNRPRRDAAGWYVLPFQGGGLTVNPPSRSSRRIRRSSRRMFRSFRR
ncbi:MAG: hypothetical protein LBG58_01995 [Planctomycetaceae bacterium]|nr:hypothetical protein [Planctomycetaceae bacterium]